MAIRRRTTEKHPHPVWQKLAGVYKVVEIEGFLFGCTDEELIAAARARTACIPVHCIEAVECDSVDEFDCLRFFNEAEWRQKIAAAKFFGSSLQLVSHVKGDPQLFRVHAADVVHKRLTFTEVHRFEKEAAFAAWWQSVKKLRQSKAQVEAAPRQELTIIDGVLGRNGLQWGGNIDGLVLTNNEEKVVALLELRQTRISRVEAYDPAKYYSGTHTKGGDFKTWLPLVYLQKAYNLPLVLLTVSTVDETKLGFTEIRGINKKQLFYVNNCPPAANATECFDRFQQWLDELINRGLTF